MRCSVLGRVFPDVSKHRSAFETSLSIQRHIPEDINLLQRRRDNLKSYITNTALGSLLVAYAYTKFREDQLAR